MEGQEPLAVIQRATLGLGARVYRASGEGQCCLLLG